MWKLATMASTTGPSSRCPLITSVTVPLTTTTTLPPASTPTVLVSTDGVTAGTGGGFHRGGRHE
jgi:hypothetical protein